MNHRYAGLGLSFLMLAGAATADIRPARQTELRGLLIQDCGSCHGLRLRGGLGPPLLPEQLSGKSREFLIGTIVGGRPGTAMPPWGSFIDVEEAAWLVDLLVSGEALTP